MRQSPETEETLLVRNPQDLGPSLRPPSHHRPARKRELHVFPFSQNCGSSPLCYLCSSNNNESLYRNTQNNPSAIIPTSTIATTRGQDTKTSGERKNMKDHFLLQLLHRRHSAPHLKRRFCFFADVIPIQKQTQPDTDTSPSHLSVTNTHTYIQTHTHKLSHKLDSRN